MVKANGEVQRNEEAQENVHTLDLFVTVRLLEDTLAVPSLGKLCEEHGYTYEWASGQKATSDQGWKEESVQDEKTSCLFVDP